MNFNVRTDARKIKKGDIFFAIKTENGDGHKYIEQAILNGASKIVAEHGTYAVDTVIVDDTRKYLEKYLKENYGKYIDEIHLIGVTGTNGKSTIVHLIYQALNKLGIKCASIGSVGYFKKEGKVCYLANTTPDLCDLYDLMMNAYNDGYRYIALEASSHALANNRMNGLNFDYTIFTNLTRDHLDEHKTWENYMNAKLKLFYMLKKTGKAIINFDDKVYEHFLLKENSNITFGFNGGDYHISDFKMNIDGSEFKLNYENNEEIFKTTLVGEYNISNLVPVIIILLDMKFNINDIKKIIPNLEAPEGRIERIKYGTNNIYIDYAHTPDGLEKVVGAISKVTKGNTYVVFCCRGNRDIGRRKGMMESATRLSKYAIVTSDNFYGEDQMHVVHDMVENLKATNYEICMDRRQAIFKGIDLLEEQDSLLVLGHGHEATLTLENHQKIPFIEKDIIEEYIKDKVI